MRRLLLLTPFLTLCVASCNQQEKLPGDKHIQFTFTKASQGSRSGSIATAADPQRIMVTIVDQAGNSVADHEVLTIYRFGDNFLSSPLTLKASANGYQLKEFVVIGTVNKVVYATPKEGSALAHLVADPLDIGFTAGADKITTVTPEVIAVDDNANAADYGYSQFGFDVVKTLSVVFTSSIEGTPDLELTTAHVTIEGLSGCTSMDTTALWKYDTELEAKANTIFFKEAIAYRITATKEGFKQWKRTLKLQQGSKLDILLEKASDLTSKLKTLSNYYQPTDQTPSEKFVFYYDENGKLSSYDRFGYVPGLDTRQVRFLIEYFNEGSDLFYTVTVRSVVNGRPDSLLGKRKIYLDANSNVIRDIVYNLDPELSQEVKQETNYTRFIGGYTVVIRGWNEESDGPDHHIFNLVVRKASYETDAVGNITREKIYSGESEQVDYEFLFTYDSTINPLLDLTPYFTSSFYGERYFGSQSKNNTLKIYEVGCEQESCQTGFTYMYRNGNVSEVNLPGGPLLYKRTYEYY